MTPTNWTGLIAVCTVLGTLSGLAIFGGRILLYLGRIVEVIDNLKELPSVIDDLRLEFRGINDRVSILERWRDTQNETLPFRRKHGDPA